jgi:hypothetical protein
MRASWSDPMLLVIDLAQADVHKWCTRETQSPPELGRPPKVMSQAAVHRTFARLLSPPSCAQQRLRLGVMHVAISFTVPVVCAIAVTVAGAGARGGAG